MSTQINQNTAVNDINEDIIVQLLTKNSDEDVFFDFKEDFNDRDDNKKHNIRKTIASFANTFGGFIFFGILDKGNSSKKRGKERIVGISDILEVGKKITEKYLANGLCIPLVDFEGPKLLKVEGKDIAIIKILRSDKSPHAVKKSQDGVLEFWTRGSGTARPMDYSDLVFAIEKNREQRGWLNALFLDAENIASIAKSNLDVAGKSDVIPDQYNSLIVKDPGNLTRTLGQDLELMKILFRSRRMITLADDARAFLLSRAALPLSNSKLIIENGNNDASLRAKEIAIESEKIRNYLVNNYPSIRELIAISQLGK